MQPVSQKQHIPQTQHVTAKKSDQIKRVQTTDLSQENTIQTSGIKIVERKREGIFGSDTGFIESMVQSKKTRVMEIKHQGAQALASQERENTTINTNTIESLHIMSSDVPQTSTIKTIDCVLTDSTSFSSADGKKALFLTTPEGVLLRPENLVFKHIEVKNNLGEEWIYPGTGITNAKSAIIIFDAPPQPLLNATATFEDIICDTTISLKVNFPTTIPLSLPTLVIGTTEQSDTEATTSLGLDFDDFINSIDSYPQLEQMTTSELEQIIFSEAENSTVQASAAEIPQSSTFAQISDELQKTSTTNDDIIDLTQLPNSPPPFTPSTIEQSAFSAKIKHIVATKECLPTITSIQWRGNHLRISGNYLRSVFKVKMVVDGRTHLFNNLESTNESLIIYIRPNTLKGRFSYIHLMYKFADLDSNQLGVKELIFHLKSLSAERNTQSWVDDL